MQDKHIKERTPTLNDIPDGIPHGYCMFRWSNGKIKLEYYAR